MTLVRLLLIALLLLAPRLYLWGTVPAGIHGDEAGQVAFGIREFAHPSPPWESFVMLPTAHFWLYGAAVALAGGHRDVWPGRAVSGVFGILGACAITAIAWRMTGWWGALIAACALASPLTLQFERMALVNIWTTALWSMALAVLVYSRRIAALMLSGALVGLSAYGYHVSRLVPGIALIGGLGALWQAPRATLRAAPWWLASCLVVAAPYLYGMWLYPQIAFGRAIATSWLAGAPASEWGRLAMVHVGMTIETMMGQHFDDSGGFFPYHLPLFPSVVVGATLIGSIGVAWRAPALWCVLVAWLVGVLGGNVLRGGFAYSCVLVCAVPACALLSSGIAAWPWHGRDLICALSVVTLVAGIAPQVWRYYAHADHVSPSDQKILDYYVYWRDHPPDGPVVQHNALLGCGGGFGQLFMPYGCRDE